VVIPDAFYVADGLLHTFMTILTEFGIFEENIKQELHDQLPFLATTKILMKAVKAGMGREVAHEIIKKHATTNTASSFFASLSNEKDFPLNLAQLNGLIKAPAAFSGSAVEQAEEITKRIKAVTKGEITKVDLQQLI
jgi:adenylosuccinate lyase